MAERRLIAIIAAMMLVTNSAEGQDATSIDDLRLIEDYVSKRAWRPLYEYLTANPHIVANKSPLATELCTFVQDVKRGNLDVFVSPWDRFVNANRFDPACNLRAASVTRTAGQVLY